MKKAFLFIFSFLLISLNIPAQSHISFQQKTSVGDIKQLLASKEYIFKAQSVNPSRGAFRQLTSEYDLRFLGDSLIVYLPYFGRAYTAPINPSSSGIQFTSTQFDYTVKERKKGWDIFVRPNDNKEVQQLILSVSQSGRATLQVLSTNREDISFIGYIEARR